MNIELIKELERFVKLNNKLEIIYEKNEAFEDLNSLLFSMVLELWILILFFKL